MPPWAAVLLAVTLASGAETPAPSLPEQVRTLALDPERCYRVRDLRFAKEDTRLYFTDGYLTFARPAGDHQIAAVFSADTPGGDGELLLFPPSRAERQSLALHTGSPNLNEHFSAAVLIFSDGSAQELEALLAESTANRKDAEKGAALAESWNPVLRNIAASFESRLLLDLYTRRPDQLGFFMAAISGKTLGNFDLWYDPRAQEQMVAGQIAERDGRSRFEVWTSFETRSFRSGRRAIEGPEVALSDYRIDAIIDPDLTLHVTTRVTVTPGAGAQHIVPMEMSGDMRMQSATIDGEAAEVMQRDSLRSNLIRNSSAELCLIVPRRPLTPGRAYELEARSSGKVILDAGNNVFYVGSRASWYPSRGLQFATYDLTFRYPKTLRLVTPGKVIEEKTEEEWRITRRKTARIRMAGFNLGDYEHARVSRGPYTVEVYANRALEQALQPRLPPPVALPSPDPPWMRNRRAPQVMTMPQSAPVIRPTSRLQDLATEVALALEFMSAHFGPPATPLLNVSPVPGRFGQGFPGLIYLSTLSYLGPQGRSVASLDDRQIAFFSDMLYAHETAHQWWGSVITTDGYRDDWLMEALANYSALLHLERQKGARTLEAALLEYREHLLVRTPDGQSVESYGPIVLGGRLTGAPHPDTWRRITYEKGSWILHMLRRRMGDDRFLSMLGGLRKKFEGKTLTTDDFRLLAAEFLPPKSPDPKLEAFFEQWVYGTGVPELEFTHSVKGKAPGLKLTGIIAQRQVDGDFTAEVPVELQFRRGKPQIVWLPATGEPTPFSIPLREPPARVILNPGQAVLARN